MSEPVPETEEQYEILPDDYTQFDLCFKIIYEFI